MMLSCPCRRLVVAGSFSTRWFSAQVQTSTSADVEEAKERGVNITLLGANGRVGTLTALQLRTSPHIRRLALHDLTSTANLAEDLGRIPSPSRCQLRAYHGPLQLVTALRDAQIVLLVAGKSWKPGMSQDDLFALNAAMVQNMTHAYANACPSAVIGVVTPPVNCNVPLVCEVMKREGKYNPDLIVGMATLEVVTANSIVGCTHNLDPSSVDVPVVGGASERTSVPVLSQATPFSNFSEHTVEDLTDMIRMAQAEVVMLGARSPKMTVSYAITRFALTLARGILGYDDAIMCAYVRSNNIQTVPYLTNRIQFGPTGVMRNLGLPRMSRNEMLLLGIAMKQLQDDVQRAVKFCENYVAPEVMTV